MKFAAAITSKTEWTEVVEDLIRQVRPQLGSEKADIAFLFMHPRYSEVAEDLVRMIHETLGSPRLIGCTGAGIIGQESEVEKGGAISLLVGHLPGVTIKTFPVKQADIEESSSPAFWHFLFGAEPAEDLSFLLFADPFSIQAIRLLEEFNQAYPETPIAGGLASGAEQAGENLLFLDGKVLEDGAVGIALKGKVALHTIVSQGCRPIGEPFVVTRAEKNILFELGGRSPLAVLQTMLPTLSQTDQQLARTSLLIGRVINEYKEEFGQGDFLVRTLIGHDPQSGALAVGDWMRTGQTVQFHVRDGKSAGGELRALLDKEISGTDVAGVRGAVLFSCLGRGEGMYGTRSHDVRLLHEYLGPVPTAGFFCNGEVGSIGGRAFVHGFTSVVGLLVES